MFRFVVVNVFSLCVDCTSPLFCREDIDGVIWVQIPLLFDLPFTIKIWMLITLLLSAHRHTNSKLVIQYLQLILLWIICFSLYSNQENSLTHHYTSHSVHQSCNCLTQLFCFSLFLLLSSGSFLSDISWCHL